MIKSKSYLSFAILLTIWLLYAGIQIKADSSEDFKLEDVQIPAGKALVVQYQPGKSVTVIENPVSLTTTATQAVKRIPQWLKIDLIDNLSQLDQTSQHKYAQLILDCPNKKYLDEIAFCLAHISPVVLKNPSFEPEIILENVRHIYQTASALKYVELIEKGETTTTRYRIKKEDKLEKYELPNEYYYWFIVHPRFFTEVPRKVLGVFWREYFFNRADEGYLKLNECLEGIKSVWDGKPCSMARAQLAKDKSLLSHALPVIGHWVLTQLPTADYPKGRPLQPNAILDGHGGTCTENQAVLSAASRAALIPSAYVRNFSEDHEWNAFYLLGKWWPYQTDKGGAALRIAEPNHISYDKEYGGKKELSAVSLVRGDGYIIERISDHSKTCSVKIKVVDAKRRPVDGVCVRIKTPRYPATTGFCGLLATFAYTDLNGECQFTLGQNRDYEVYASTPQLGKTKTVKISKTDTGKAYQYPLILPKEKKKLAFRPLPQPEGPAQVELDISCQPHSYILYGKNVLQDFRKQEVRPEFSQRLPKGKLKVLVCDAANYEKHKKGKVFSCYSTEVAGQEAQKIILNLPNQDKWFIVFYNDAFKVRIIADICIRK